MIAVAKSNHKLLTNAEAAALLGIRPNTLEIWRTKGIGPEFVKMGRNKQAPVRYVESKIVTWLENHSCASTSAYHPIGEQQFQSNRLPASLCMTGAEGVKND